MSEPRYIHFTMPKLSLSWIKSNPGVSLMSASILVSATRLGDAFADAAGSRITGGAWEMLHAASGIGLAFIEPVAIFYCVRALSKARGRSPWASRVLVALLSLSVLCLVIIGLPVVVSKTLGMTEQELLDRWQLWIWGGAIAVSNMILMASAAIADHLNSLRAVNTVDAKIRMRKPASRKLPPAGSLKALPKPGGVSDEEFMNAWYALPDGQKTLSGIMAALGMKRTAAWEKKRRLIDGK